MNRFSSRGVLIYAPVMRAETSPPALQTVRRSVETNRGYAPTNSSICGMLFLPNSTRCVPSARVMTMQGTLIAP